MRAICPTRYSRRLRRRPPRKGQIASGLGRRLDRNTGPARRPAIRRGRSRAPSALVADRQPRTIADLAASLEDTDFQTLVYRTRDGHDVCSR
ncbi:MAG: hypothetical protein ACR2H2_02350, partial [Solirubrobacteraceae bacterium]